MFSFSSTLEWQDLAVLQISPGAPQTKQISYKVQKSKERIKGATREEQTFSKNKKQMTDGYLDPGNNRH